MDSKKMFFNFVTRFFTGFVLVAAISSCWNDGAVDGMQIVGMFGLTCILGLITMVRIRLDKQKWMLKLSFLTKCWLFLPLYLLATLGFLYQYGPFEAFGWEEILWCSGVFLLFAVVFSPLGWLWHRAAKRQYTASVEEYKKKIEQNEP